VEDFSENGFCSAVGLKDKDAMEISVCGNEERILLIARYDNLGKGASGAAVQCMNIALGYDETKGLEL
jgi:N-acetyl-gamma-glutamyl-phosphate reductase